MSAEVETGAEQIELHFCHHCGISIPQVDIETGRAQPVPGGFVCAGCVYQERDAQALPGTPARRAPHAPWPKRDAGARILIVSALLYVVGATTFLLARELTRPAPAGPRTDLATSADIESLSRKIDQLDAQSRSAFLDLKSNDDRQRQDLATLSGTVNALKQEAARSASRLRARIDEVESAVLALVNKTGVLKEDVADAASELRRLRERLSERGSSPAPGGESAKAAPEPAPGQADTERERLVKQYIAKLADRTAANKTRYNAAVQLGDLKHPDAIPALVGALKEDPYDLVRRAAAWSLGMFGKDAVPAIPALIGELGGKEAYVAYMSERALGEITKAVLGKAVTFNLDPTMNLRQRKRIQKEWESWWAKNREQMVE